MNTFSLLHPSDLLPGPALLSLLAKPNQEATILGNRRNFQSGSRVRASGGRQSVDLEGQTEGVRRRVGTPKR